MSSFYIYTDRWGSNGIQKGKLLCVFESAALGEERACAYMHAASDGGKGVPPRIEVHIDILIKIEICGKKMLVIKKQRRKNPKMKILLPKNYVDPKDLPKPLFFLAGPVRGGDDWQYRCVKMLEKRFEDFSVAIPCRYDAEHPLKKISLVGAENVFERQTQWERFYLQAASEHGCIIFWLPEESKIHPRDDGDPYARDSYGELGEWRGRMMNDLSGKTCVIIGAESGFPGLSQIQCNFDSALEKKVLIHATLEEVISDVKSQMENRVFS